MDPMLHEKRFLATIIDAGIGAFLSLLLSFITNLMFDISFMNFDYYYLIMFTITMFLYQLFSLILSKSHTLGLYLMGLKLLSSDWEKVNIKQNVLRAVSISIPILFVINLLYMITYKTKSSTLFDNVSDTMVVNVGVNYQVNSKSMLDKIVKK